LHRALPRGDDERRGGRGRGRGARPRTRGRGDAALLLRGRDPLPPRARARPGARALRGDALMAKDPLQRAIEDGDAAAARARLAEEPALATARLKGGQGYLRLAAGEPDGVAIVEALLEAGADPNARDDHGMAPLHYAIGANRPPAEGARVIERLLAAGAD